MKDEFEKLAAAGKIEGKHVPALAQLAELATLGELTQRRGRTIAR